MQEIGNFAKKIGDKELLAPLGDLQKYSEEALAVDYQYVELVKQRKIDEAMEFYMGPLVKRRKRTSMPGLMGIHSWALAAALESLGSIATYFRPLSIFSMIFLSSHLAHSSASMGLAPKLRRSLQLSRSGRKS